MDRKSLSPNIFEGLPEIFPNLPSAPEFYLPEGDFLTKLEHVCYYQFGNFQYPPKLMLSHVFKNVGEKLKIAVAIQNIQIKIVLAPVYQIPGDVAIMAQDANQVIGPTEEIILDEDVDIQREMKETVKALEDFKPHPLGTILVSSPNWCKAKYLLQAIVYQFEAEEITNREAVSTALHECFEKCQELKITDMAMDALGTEYRGISPQFFVEVLQATLVQFAGQLTELKQVSIAVRNHEQALALKKAFIDVLNIKMP